MSSQLIKIWAGPLVGILLALGMLGVALPPNAAYTAGVTAVCVYWWVTEALPIPVTSLLPFVAFPVLGIIDQKAVASSYGHPMILLLLGGFMLSTAMSASGAHKRIAIGIIRAVGTGGDRQVVLGFMLATALCSMWISNTATTLMLLPVALAVLEHSDNKTLSVPLLLGIAYAASIGGMGTPIGTPPNLIFMAQFEKVAGRTINFVEWMLISMPLIAILLPAAWWWLTRGLSTSGRISVPNLGRWNAHETRVLFVFAITALLWVTRTAPGEGWSRWFPSVGDSTVALAAVLALFLIPNGHGSALVTWETASKIPWGLLLLFGGGLAIAQAFEASGLSQIIGTTLMTGIGLDQLHALVILAAICIAVTFLTEVTSNTATTTLLMPILAASATACQLPPAWLMIPATLSASCAFMLPVATAPNAVVFGTNLVSTKEMARNGLALNLFGAAIIPLLCYVIVDRVLL